MPKHFLLKIFLILSVFCFNSCSKSGCDDCTLQKEEYCKALYEVNCNGAMLTTNIDYLVRACGTTEANNYISETTAKCSQGTLTCSNECQ